MATPLTYTVIQHHAFSVDRQITCLFSYKLASIFDGLVTTKSASMHCGYE